MIINFVKAQPEYSPSPLRSEARETAADDHGHRSPELVSRVLCSVHENTLHSFIVIGVEDLSKLYNHLNQQHV